MGMKVKAIWVNEEHWDDFNTVAKKMGYRQHQLFEQMLALYVEQFEKEINATRLGHVKTAKVPVPVPDPETVKQLRSLRETHNKVTMSDTAKVTWGNILQELLKTKPLSNEQKEEIRAWLIKLADIK